MPDKEHNEGSGNTKPAGNEGGAKANDDQRAAATKTYKGGKK